MPSMQHVAWILDSGASIHKCSNGDLMHTIYKLDTPVHIHLPDGSCKSVACVGMKSSGEQTYFVERSFVCTWPHSVIFYL